jgi:hypothetical protein
MKLDRTCYKCGTDFELKPTDKASNICYPCKREYQKNIENKKSKVFLDGYKEPYPIPDNQRRKRFNKLVEELEAIDNREEWIELLKYRLDNIEPAILKWIYDRRSQSALQEELDRKVKKEDTYEDTRTTHNNTKSWFD